LGQPDRERKQMKWAALMLGGGLGASMRYALTVWLDARHATVFPWGTLAVNFLGCFLIGAVVATFEQRGGLTPALRLFVISGVLGGFTTFSAFSLDIWRLIELGKTSLAVANAAGSLVACLVATFAGIALARHFG